MQGHIKTSFGVSQSQCPSTFRLKRNHALTFQNFCVHTRTRTRARTRARTHKHTHTNQNFYLNTHTHIHKHARTHARARTHTYTQARTQTTHTQTNKQTRLCAPLFFNDYFLYVLPRTHEDDVVGPTCQHSFSVFICIFYLFFVIT